MPNPAQYKDQKIWMKDCLHQTLHVEKGEKDQSLARCLNQWRNRKKKKCVAELLRGLCASLIESKYMREKGHGTPGQPGYKPPLWYMITPEGKKVLVDQKTGGG